MAGPVDRYYTDHPPALMTLRAGDAVLIDTRVMHGGGANVSRDRERALLHFSLETTAEVEAPRGFTHNLDPRLRAESARLGALLA
jgi:ectoine hydroxylase-related dioxygenase (phytanoyl-CoA dioxygenase family)